MSHNLEKYNLTQLKKIANDMDLRPRRSKDKMISDISCALKEYEDYKRKKLDKYTRKEQLGNKGKEGTTYLVTDRRGREYAMKTFRSKKSSNTLEREYLLQKKAAKAGISPKVYDYDTVSKYIVMERMDKHLLQVIKEQKGILYKYQQKRILEIYDILDKIGIFHDDANILNYMLKGKTIYIIDFGFAKEVNERLIKKHRTDKPNRKLMLIGFILKLKELGIPETSWDYLKSKLDERDISKYKI